MRLPRRVFNFFLFIFPWKLNIKWMKRTNPGTQHKFLQSKQRKYFKIKYNSFFKVKQAIFQQFSSTSSSFKRRRPRVVQKKGKKNVICWAICILDPSIWSSCQGIMTMICFWCNELWNNLLSMMFIRLVCVYVCVCLTFILQICRIFVTLALLIICWVCGQNFFTIVFFCILVQFFVSCGNNTLVNNKWNCRCFWHSGEREKYEQIIFEQWWFIPILRWKCQTGKVYSKKKICQIRETHSQHIRCSYDVRIDEKMEKVCYNDVKGNCCLYCVRSIQINT